MSVLGESDRALTLLEGVAAKASAGTLSWIEADSDLDAVRREARYVALVEAAKARLAAAGATSS
jgi:hypothetical protein